MTLPGPQPFVGRAELLQAVAQAASRSAAGAPYDDSIPKMAGRRFELRLPFGCFGPGAGDIAYAYDAKSQALKLTASPVDWTDTPWAARLAHSGDVEAVEGFWIRRPWLLVETCPVAGLSGEAGAAPETVGLAEVFETGGSRLSRRGGRAYQVTRKTPPEAVGAGGWRLVLRGRIASDETPVRCANEGPETRPACLVRVVFERVAFEDGAGQTLAEWSN
ncbi:hypothetical protein [Phenylobacterium deserti]|uniref:Uncharacterized protein n=1 Tax=Phenylobacterium deserti TaxID=1914756 RepID=A0A328ACP1_9CAUL|nr:hypothetical protein [Phenylobacterium deserti]RAK52583.1 hypothetical protein DJ018_10250 [Phenylobacterium deserti]